MILANEYRGAGIPELGPMPLEHPERVVEALQHGFDFAETALAAAPDLAGEIGCAELWLKDERGRLGLGSFKALGAAFVVALDALRGHAEGKTYVAASAGNHGISLAAGARAFGARSVILLSDTVPDTFADKLRGIGAEVRRAGAVYEESMSAAEDLAKAEGWTLLSDSSWPGYTELPSLVMQGYTQIAAECAQQMAAPSHIFLQAGVGGLAAGFAAHARVAWGQAPRIIVVEPAAAPALIEAIKRGQIVRTEGPVSAMGRLDCKEASMVALAGLARDADHFMTVSEAEAQRAVDLLGGAGFSTSASGAAGVAGAMALDLPKDARVLCILSEEA